jgi:hypothetical protein
VADKQEKQNTSEIEIGRNNETCFQIEETTFGFISCCTAAKHLLSLFF